MDNLIRDLQFSLRLLARQPGFSILATLALAIGISSVATQSSIIYSVLYRGLPYPQADRLVHVERNNLLNANANQFQREIPIQDLKVLQERQKSFEGLGGFFGGTVNFTFQGVPHRVNGARISGDFAQWLGVQALLGRAITAEDDRPGAPAVMLLSYGVWQKYFNGSAQVVGAPVRVNGQPGTVIGVMPQNFKFPLQEDVWIPLYQAENPDVARPNGFNVEVFGLLKNGVSEEQASVEIGTILASLEKEFPQYNEGFSSAELKAYHKEFIDEETRLILWAMFVAVILVLLVACANVANMLLARAAVRSKELAIRSSLGASRRRVIYQLLTESIVLASIGGILGVVRAYYLTGEIWKEANANQDIPGWMEFAVEPAVLLFSLCVTLLTGILAGLVPALKATRANVNEILKDDSRTGSSLHIGSFTKMLVAVQIAFSCILLVVAGLLLKGAGKLNQADFGFNKDAAITARMGLFEGDYPEPGDRWRFMNRLLQRLEERPEIQTAALSSRYRFGWSGGSIVQAEGIDIDESSIPFHNIERVSWNYFQAMDMQALAGRLFEERDTLQADRLVIINELYAEKVFPGENPVGRRLTLRSGDGQVRQSGEDVQWREIIGVVPDTRMQGLLNSDFDGGGVFLLMTEKDIDRFNTLIVRGPEDPTKLIPLLREEIRALDPNLPIYAVGTPRQLIDEDNSQFMFLADTFGTFGLIALFLGAIGIYGIMSFSVNQRRQEWGIRAALGARPRSILKLIIAQGMRQAGIGLGIGLAIAYLAALTMKTHMDALMYGVSPQDPFTYLKVVLTLASVALLACLIPALRASRVHPMQALRYE